jgi:hypothetical protein
MATERERRIALNESAFRIANERMAEWEERHREDKLEDYVCECGDPDCRAQVLLTGREYEAVRSDPKQFLVVPGHQIEDVERVSLEHERYFVVEKPPGLQTLTERTDPRTDTG